MSYDLNWNTNSYSSEFKSHMEDFILVIIILLSSDKGFGSTLVGYIYVPDLVYLVFVIYIQYFSL